MENRLTERQKRWALEYVASANASDAARKAGYKDGKTSGKRNLANRILMSYVQDLMDEHKKETIATADEILEYLTRCLRGEEKEPVMVFDREGEPLYGEKDLMARDKLKAAELLAKRYGLFKEQLDLSGQMQLDVLVDYGADNDSGE